MRHSALSSTIRRRKEAVFFLGVLCLGALLVASALSGWLEEETWGQPVTTRKVHGGEAQPEVVFADFSSIWQDGGRNPFGDAAVVLESGGRAKIRLPWPPPLVPEMPPAPMVRPIDLLTEGAR